MKLKSKKKTILSFLLTSFMIITLFPSTITNNVYATENEFPTKEQFATREQLKNFNTDDTTDGIKNPAKVYFGNNNQQWWIAGSQSENSLTLFASTHLKENCVFSNNTGRIPYESRYCNYVGEPPIKIEQNHYAISYIRGVLGELEKSYFSTEEQSLMNDTLIYTDDPANKKVFYTSDKLYLGYTKGRYYSYITVGKNSPNDLNNGLRIDKDYLKQEESLHKNYFWLRNPYYCGSGLNNLGFYYDGFNMTVNNSDIGMYIMTVMPAFEFNLSSVLFASKTPAVIEDGTLSLNDAMTLRYSATDLGSAFVPYKKNEVQLTEVPQDTYLVVQNNKEAHAKKVSGTTFVSADEMGLDSFKNCKVWLEKTNSNERMTYATLAVEEKSNIVNITLPEGMRVSSSSGSLTQEVAEQNKIKNIEIELEDGYEFPENYSVEEKNGITVTRNSAKQITISGKPTADVSLSLPAAFKIIYSMNLYSSNKDFKSVCVGYEQIESQAFKIQNRGTVDLTELKVSLAGKDKDDFIMNFDNSIKSLKPDEIVTGMIQPKENLPTDKYEVEIVVSAKNIDTVKANKTFVVMSHGYKDEWVVDDITHWHECKKCHCKINEVSHTFKWVIDKEATGTEKGSKHEECKVCKYKKAIIEIPAKGTKPNDNKPNIDKDNNNSYTDKENGKVRDIRNLRTNKDNVKTGDNTNPGLYAIISMLTLSVLFIVILMIFKKRKVSEG